MKTIFICSHTSGIDGPIDYLEEYLISRGFSVSKLEHPLRLMSNSFSYFYMQKKLIKRYKRKDTWFINYFVDMCLSLNQILRNAQINLFFGANNFDTLVGVIARHIFRKKITKIIYFASDFSENRFNSVILDELYYLTEKIALRYADLVISNTKRAKSKRLKLGLNLKKSKVLPNCANIKQPIFTKKQIDKSKFVFEGNVSKTHGLFDLIKEISPIIKQLVIVGQGEDLDRTLRLCKKLNIKFKLFHKKKHDFVIKYLQKFSGIGLAPYNAESKWTYYCSPLKVNEYVACGVPVLMSSLPEISNYIEGNNLGVVYKNIDLNEIKAGLLRFSTDNFNKKAMAYFEKFSPDSLYREITI